MTPPEFSPSLDYTGHLFRRAQQLHVALWNREVSRDVSSVQYAALRVISERPGMSQRELGSELDLDRSTIADLVERMVRRGFLTREQSTEDRRRKVLTLSAQGEETLVTLTPGVHQVDVLLTRGLDGSTRDELRELLRRILRDGIDGGLLDPPRAVEPGA